MTDLRPESFVPSKDLHPVWHDFLYGFALAAATIDCFALPGPEKQAAFLRLWEARQAIIQTVKLAIPGTHDVIEFGAVKSSPA